MRYVGIDPSTKTGLVAIDENENVLKQKELKGLGKDCLLYTSPSPRD